MINDETERQNKSGDWKACCPVSPDMMKLGAIIGGSLLIGAVMGATYYIWCPESSRFDGQYTKRQWWQRLRYHLMH